MAKKSKTQRAKASAVRSAKKAQAQIAEEQEPIVAEAPESKGLLKSFSKKEDTAVTTTKKAEKKPEKKEKKERFQFLKDVRSEMKRVTWPTRQDVIRWSFVVVGALVFFGCFVALLDNVIITPALVALSGLGA